MRKLWWVSSPSCSSSRERGGGRGDDGRKDPRRLHRHDVADLLRLDVVDDLGGHSRIRGEPRRHLPHHRHVSALVSGAPVRFRILSTNVGDQTFVSNPGPTRFDPGSGGPNSFSYQWVERNDVAALTPTSSACSGEARAAARSLCSPATWP